MKAAHRIERADPTLRPGVEASPTYPVGQFVRPRSRSACYSSSSQEVDQDTDLLVELGRVTHQDVPVDRCSGYDAPREVLST